MFRLARDLISAAKETVENYVAPTAPSQELGLEDFTAAFEATKRVLTHLAAQEFAMTEEGAQALAASSVHRDLSMMVRCLEVGAGMVGMESVAYAVHQLG